MGIQHISIKPVCNHCLDTASIGLLARTSESGPTNAWASLPPASCRTESRNSRVFPVLCELAAARSSPNQITARTLRLFVLGWSPRLLDSNTCCDGSGLLAGRTAVPHRHHGVAAPLT